MNNNNLQIQHFVEVAGNPLSQISKKAGRNKNWEKNNSKIKFIYTIGHSNYEIDYFLKIVYSYNIEIIVDVRSVPYSKYCPQFNKEPIKKSLNNSGIKYLFLGKELGARPDEPSCYCNGKVKFDILRATELFKRGIYRLEEEVNKGCILAIMCSEKNPIDCHRTILISRVLKKNGLDIKHIVSDIETINQNEIEKQLKKEFNLQPLLFDKEDSPQQRIEEAYKKQEERIT
jgi:hypothetical protein